MMLANWQSMNVVLILLFEYKLCIFKLFITMCEVHRMWSHFMVIAVTFPF